MEKKKAPNPANFVLEDFSLSSPMMMLTTPGLAARLPDDVLVMLARAEPRAAMGQPAVLARLTNAVLEECARADPVGAVCCSEVHKRLPPDVVAEVEAAFKTMLDAEVKKMERK